nr:hypothetical protein [Tanacetum cinerariifolium]
MDVKSAFLYGTIEEEIYVCQPPGFEDLDYLDKVYKVVKALYGLHRACDYAGASLDRKSTTGDYQFLGCRLIFWQCKKHTIVATSSTGANSAKTKKHDNKTKREAKGKSLVELSTGFRNLTLEDITYFDDEEDVGADVNFSNLKTNITVSPIPTTRVHKDHPITQIIGDFSSAPQTRSITRMVKEQGARTQINNDDFHTCMFSCFLSQEEPKRMDVKSAFLYETIEEEVYVCQPPGFKDPDYPDKVYKVVKALYGLHQAPKAWYETLANYLLENGFQRGKIDQTLFIKKQKGLQVKQKQDGIFISQDKFVAEILRKFGLTNEKSASTPIDTEKPLLKDPDGEDVDVHTY